MTNLDIPTVVREFALGQITDPGMRKDIRNLIGSDDSVKKLYSDAFSQQSTADKGATVFLNKDRYSTGVRGKLSDGDVIILDGDEAVMVYGIDTPQVSLDGRERVKCLLARVIFEQVNSDPVGRDIEEAERMEGDFVTAYVSDQYVWIDAEDLLSGDVQENFYVELGANLVQADIGNSPVLLRGNSLLF